MLPFVKECNYCYGRGKVQKAIFPEIVKNPFSKAPTSYETIKEEMVDCPTCEGKGYINIIYGFDIINRKFIATDVKQYETNLDIINVSN